MNIGRRARAVANMFGKPTTGWDFIAKYHDLNMGEWGVYGEPRRSGYAYNWARSGATSGEMISNGQLTGALRQVLAHKVSHTLVQIGINDFYFSGLGYEIYDGTISTEDTMPFSTKRRATSSSRHLRCKSLTAITSLWLPCRTT